MITSATPFIFVGDAGRSHVGNYGQAAGMVRFNTSSQHLEAYDGSTWIQIANHQSVGMTQEAIEAIQWARGKITKENQLKELAAKHPGVSDAMQQLQKASEQLEIMVQLVNQDNSPVV